MTDVESFKRQTGVKIDYREFGIDELAPAPILQPPPAPTEPVAEPPAKPPKAIKPPAPPGAPTPQAQAQAQAQAHASPADAFARYAPPPAKADDVLLSDLFKRLER